MKHWILILTALTLAACGTTPVATPVEKPYENIAKSSDEIVQLPGEPAEIATPPPAPRIPLYWENTTEAHPERALWSDEVIAGFRADLPLYSSAQDIEEICPKYHSLTDDNKLKALGELWVALAWYESAFSPTAESVDVGVKEDKGSWSVGLYQMSANDNSAKEVRAGYRELKNPHVNILVSLVQVKKQIKFAGKFFLNNWDRMKYWATMLHWNRYNKIKEIKARVAKHAPACVKQHSLPNDIDLLYPSLDARMRRSSL